MNNERFIERIRAGNVNTIPVTGAIYALMWKALDECEVETTRGTAAVPESGTWPATSIAYAKIVLESGHWLCIERDFCEKSILAWHLTSVPIIGAPRHVMPLDEALDVLLPGWDRAEAS